MDEYELAINDPKVIAAVIAAVIALIGVIFTSIMSYRAGVKQKTLEIETRQKQQQEVFYSDFLKSLQLVMNNPEKEFEAFQLASLKCMAHADNTVAFHIGEYYQAILEANNNKNPLSESEHNGYHSAIINSIRAAQNLNALDNVIIAAYYPKKAALEYPIPLISYKFSTKIKNNSSDRTP